MAIIVVCVMSILSPLGNQWKPVSNVVVDDLNVFSEYKFSGNIAYGLHLMVLHFKSINRVSNTYLTQLPWIRRKGSSMHKLSWQEGKIRSGS